jgi:chromosome partitioning protein
MYTVTLSKFKGGVAATETTVQLATLYALAGWRVLVVDTDPQGGATKRFFPNGDGDALPTLADAVRAYVADRKSPVTPLSQVNRITRVRQDARKKEFTPISVVPASRALQDEESNIGNMPVGRTKVLKRMLATVANQYDLCLIDTPPVFGYLSRNAVVAANGLLLPLLPEPASFNALQELRNELAMMAEEDEIPAIVGTIATRFCGKSIRHEIGETLLKIAGGENSIEALSLFDGSQHEFNAGSINGFKAPYLGSVANDNSQVSPANLRKAYKPIAKALAKSIGLGVLNFEVMEVQNETISN